MLVIFFFNERLMLIGIDNYFEKQQVSFKTLSGDFSICIYSKTIIFYNL